MVSQGYRSSLSIALLALILVPHLIGLGTADAPVTTIGVWNSVYASRNVTDTSLTPGNIFTIDINATDLPAIINSTDGGLNAFDVTVYYNPAVLNASDAGYKAPLCPSTEGCLFDRTEAVSFAHRLNSTLGTVRIASALFGTAIDTPGTLFKISFKVVGIGHSAIHIGEESQLAGPNSQAPAGVGTVPYGPLDGFFDNSPPNLLPQAQFTATPQSVTVNQQVTFDGSPSSDPDGYITNYRWDFGDGYSATGSTVTHSFASPRDYTVTLTVTDDRGGTGTSTLTVSVSPAPNLLPLASFTFNPASPTAGQQVTFDASQSNDPDGTLVQYHWDFGDGYSASGMITTHSFASARDYMVALTVTDDRGGSGANSLTVTVSAVPNSLPVASFAFNPSSPTAGQPVTFDASQSNDPDGYIASYSWDFGDGYSATGSMVTHSFVSPRDYTVTLTVTDDQGGTGTNSLTVGISAAPNLLPSAVFAFNPASPTVGQQVTFDGAQSSDPDGIIVQYRWNFSDTNTATGSQATHSFQSTGNYTVTLTVTDNNGAMASKALTITVTGTNQSPPLPVDFQTLAIVAVALFAIITALVLITRRGKR